jgi:hypothetical protein
LSHLELLEAVWRWNWGDSTVVGGGDENKNDSGRLWTSGWLWTTRAVFAEFDTDCRWEMAQSAPAREAAGQAVT